MADDAAVARELQQEQPTIDQAVKNWLAFKMAQTTAGTALTPVAAQKAQMTAVGHARKILQAVNAHAPLPSPEWGALRPQGAEQGGMARMAQLTRYNVLRALWERAAAVPGAKTTKLFGRSWLLACWPEIEAALLPPVPASAPVTAPAAAAAAEAAAEAAATAERPAAAPVEIWHNGELVKTIGGDGSGGGGGGGGGAPPAPPPSAAAIAAAKAEAEAAAFAAFVRGFGRTVALDGAAAAVAAAEAAAAAGGGDGAAVAEAAEAADAAELVWATDFDGVLRQRQERRKAEAARRVEEQAEAGRQQADLLRAAMKAPREYDADDEPAEEEGGSAVAAVAE
jgi:hypothetical protein